MIGRIGSVKQIGKSESDGILIGITLVDLKEGTVPVRFCVDYQNSYAVNHQDTHPLSRPHTVLDLPSDSSWFFTLDQER